MIPTSGRLVWTKDIDTGLHKLAEPWACVVDFEAPIVLRGIVPHLCVERRGDGLLWMCLDEGFLWDGASGPTEDDDDGSWDPPPTFHDGGCRLIRYGVKRGGWPESLSPKVDAQFEKMLKERPPRPPVFEVGGPWYRRLGRTLFTKPLGWTWYGFKRLVRPVRADAWYGAVRKFEGDAARTAPEPERHVSL